MKQIKPLILFFLTVVFISSCSEEKKDNKQELIQEIDGLIEQTKQYIHIDLDSAFYFANKAIQNSQLIEYKEGEMNGEFQIGRVYNDQARRVLAMESGKRSLKIAEEIDNYQGKKNSLNLIGKIQNHSNQLEEGIKTIRRNFNLAKMQKDSVELALMYNFLGIFKNKMKESDSSFYFTMESMKINKKLKNQKTLAYNYNSLGIHHYGKGNLDTSFAYFRKSLKIRTNLKLPNQSIESYNNLGYVFLMEKIADSAVIYFQKSIELCLQHEKKSNLDVLYENLSNSYKISGNHELALLSIEKSIPIKDSLMGIQQYNQIIKREKERVKEQKILEETNINKLKKKNRDKFILILILITLLILAFIILNVIKKNRINEILSKQKQQAAKSIIDEYEKIDNWIAKELHDDIGGSISAIRLKLSRTQEEVSKAFDENVKEGNSIVEVDVNQYQLSLKSLKHEIKNLRDVHTNIRNLSHNLVPVSFEGDSFLSLLESKISDRFPEEMNLIFNIYPEDKLNKIDSDLKFNVYRILQGLSINIIRHSKAKNITLQVVGHNNHLTIIAEDDGIGFDPEIKHNGAGLEIIKKRVILFDGKINFDTQKGVGSTIIIELPYKNKTNNHKIEKGDSSIL